MVDVRMSKPAENFYELPEPNRGHALKQDLNTLRKMLLQMTVCSFFHAFGIKEGT